MDAKKPPLNQPAARLHRQLREYVNQLRRAVADYMASEGCGCCRGSDHDEHTQQLAELLGVPEYEDGSGYDFARFRRPPE